MSIIYYFIYILYILIKNVKKDVRKGILDTKEMPSRLTLLMQNKWQCRGGCKQQSREIITNSWDRGRNEDFGRDARMDKCKYQGSWGCGS